MPVDGKSRRLPITGKGVGPGGKRCFPLQSQTNTPKTTSATPGRKSDVCCGIINNLNGPAIGGGAINAKTASRGNALGEAMLTFESYLTQCCEEYFLLFGNLLQAQIRSSFVDLSPPAFAWRSASLCCQERLASAEFLARVKLCWRSLGVKAACSVP